MASKITTEQTQDLTKEIASPSTLSIRTVWQESVASGLTPDKLATVLIGADQNDITSFLTLAEEMEERDLHYHSVLSTRKMAVSGLKGFVEATSDEEKEVKIRDEIQTICDSEMFSDMVTDIMDAIGKGFAVSEIIWDRSGILWEPKSFITRDQRFFQFDNDTMSELRLRDEKDLINGIPLSPYKFIQHRPHIKTGIPIRGGLARLAVIAFMCKGYALKDWLSFAEVFGMPLRLGKYDTGATPAQKAALLSAVANIGTDAAAIIPQSMAIEFISTTGSSGGDKLFYGLADWLDKQVSKGVLGQTMTTDDGSSLSQARVHDSVRKDIMMSDAKQLAATINRFIVKPYVDLNYGERKANQYPKYRVQYEEPEDLESLSRSLPAFINLGLRVEESVIRDKFGLPEPEEGAKVLGSAPKNAPFPGYGGDITPSPISINSGTEPQLNSNNIIALLTKKVLDGETLTQDQRLLLEMAITKKEGRKDDIDILTEEAASEADEILHPMLKPIFDIAEKTENYEDFLAELQDLSLNKAELSKMIATLTFKAKGLGNAAV